MSLGLSHGAYRPLLLQFKDCSGRLPSPVTPIQGLLRLISIKEKLRFCLDSRGGSRMSYSISSLGLQSSRHLVARRTREGLGFLGVSQSAEKKMENRYGYYYQGSALWRSLRDGDFEEADVWEVLNGRQDSNNSHLRASGGGGGGSSSSTPEPAARVVQHSAPVNIPYWSKLQRQKSKKAPSNSKRAKDWDEEEDGADSSDDGGAGASAVEGERGGSEEDEDEADCKMPPHELIAMRLARSHISSFSVVEGEGRTLKGRDLSKVRNAVLTRTGFLESP
ncbi:hypothetical protein BT93_F1280 [Corymbia citriodora subsp. variegata]|nr:hypothetical protein BT93_F1280 [Corymbia citriodora subsp. variegata]